jgi:hypothetical protein
MAKTGWHHQKTTPLWTGARTKALMVWSLTRENISPIISPILTAMGVLRQA